MRSNANPVEYRTARFLVCEDGGEMKRIRNHNCAVGGCLAPSGHLSLQGRIEKKAVAKDLLLNEREREREREREVPDYYGRAPAGGPDEKRSEGADAICQTSYRQEEQQQKSQTRERDGVRASINLFTHC